MWRPVRPNVEGYRSGKMTWFGLCWRGILMGVVEVLPGISGGTIALLTQIYDRLVNALSQIAKFRASEVERGSWLSSLKFLAQLGLWMVCGFIASMLTILEFVHREPQLFWGVILGIVIGAVFQLARSVNRQDLIRYVPLGLLVGIPIVALPAASLDPPLWLFAVGGIGAFSAWILPGISGSMMLLLMGIWVPTLEAVRHVELTKLALFASGMAIAFMVLPRILASAVRRYRQPMLAFFIGLVASTLYRAWPWRTDAGYPELPTLDVNAQILAVLVCVVLGCASVLLLMRLVDRNVA